MVEGGCIGSYNKPCKPGYQVILGVTVNGVHSDVALMLNELNVAGKHEVAIERQ